MMMIMIMEYDEIQIDDDGNDQFEDDKYVIDVKRRMLIMWT